MGFALWQTPFFVLERLVVRSADRWAFDDRLSRVYGFT